jgi:cytochrome o ubiquinol oxidase subunit 1
LDTASGPPWPGRDPTEPIVLATFAASLGGIALVAALTYFRLGLSLERVVHQRRPQEDRHHVHGAGPVMFLRGFADAIMIRSQQALGFGGSDGYLNSHHFDQVFTAHGVIMIFFVAMPFVTGLMNYVVPLQIGARDVSFPFLNNFSFWMTAGGAVLVMPRCSSVSLRVPAGWPIPRCRVWPTALTWVSTTTSGRFRWPVSARRFRAST